MNTLTITALLASLVVAAPCAGPASLSKRATDDCDAAPNCEVYTTPDGRTSMRFVENMGPGSAWYNQTVHPKDHAFQRRIRSGKLARRQDDVHTNAAASTETLNFGSWAPSDVVHQMYDHCGTFTCDDVSWTVDAEYVDSAGAAVETKTLGISTTGQWDQMVSDESARSYFIDALVQLATTGVTVEGKDWINGGVYGEISEGTVSEHTASHSFSMNRYVGEALAGFATVTIVEVPSDSKVCEDVTSALSSVAGAVSGIGGAFFGLLGFACT